ncbi:DoxX family protein [Uliginosibacterium sediminicola]|uniref:DoxX family protein n=1 Tax=Uliginosibacterium sediminicola TaxID=2024550 RepID=A0ABU9YYI1_9RHOO
MTTTSIAHLKLNPLAYIRIACGLLYVPHILFKLNGMSASAAFFAKAGFQPPMFFLILGLIMETVCAIGLTFNILTKWIGLASAGVLLVATYATLATKGFGWLWNLGGIEYLLLWVGLSLMLAINAWQEEYAEFGRVSLLFPKRR